MWVGNDLGIGTSFWRAIAIFRLASLGHAAVLLIGAAGYARPAAGWTVLAAMAAWTAVTAVAYERRAGWPLLATDLAVTVACLLASRIAQGADAAGVAITATWVGGPVLAWAVFGGRRAGVLAAIVVAAADAVQRGSADAVVGNAAVLLLLAGVAVGHVARLAGQAERRLQQAAEAEAATRERERIARGIHDSVLQVLAMVQRRGREIGGDAAELGRLAGEQERALRLLVRGTGSVSAAGSSCAGGGSVDLAELLRGCTAADVTATVAGSPIMLPTKAATEVTAAVRAALDNVRRHCGPNTRAWIFAEHDDATVTVTVRDDGAGIADGRLEQAAADGRMGVARSIRGRIAELGGTVRISSAPGDGTEVELTVPAMGAAMGRRS